MAHLRPHLDNLRTIFLRSVEAVVPSNLFEPSKYTLTPKLENDTELINIQGTTYDLFNKQCYIVGFGKAVLGMAVRLERSLTKHLVSGILSVPLGTKQKFIHDPNMQLSYRTKIKVYECAPNNQPDEAAMEVAEQIRELALKMGPDDVLFVLISGGGSALLPLPIPTIQLEQKQELIQNLSNCGANIKEMNIVRIALSEIKGGRLAAAAKNASAVISLVISDVVHDPLDLIASGPTVPYNVKNTKALNILQKYKLWDDLPEEIQDPIIFDDLPEQPGPNNAVYIVASNKIATEKSAIEGENFGYIPFVVSTSIQGTIHKVQKLYLYLIELIRQFQYGEITEEDFEDKFPFNPNVFDGFLKCVKKSFRQEKPLLLIFGGEPTVQVTGTGKGGRSQELAMRMSLAFYEGKCEFGDVSFLSAGTDGIDGPTSAAGALGSRLVVEEFFKERNKSVANYENFLYHNDSYTFYKYICKDFHIVTGHTGTNVMDLHYLLIS